MSAKKHDNFLVDNLEPEILNKSENDYKELDEKIL